MLFPKKKIGILGGGQLGKMLAQAASPLDLPIYFLDKSRDFPAGKYCSGFVEGDFNNFEDVYRFGKEMDVISIEIEHVNTEALHRLKAEGKTIHPDPGALDIIKDKGLQKSFYKEKALPTSPFTLYESGEEIRGALASGELSYPFVQKSRAAGYDGKGVALIQTEQDLGLLLPQASIVEPLVNIHKEIAVIASRNEKGEIATFPPVEMVFNPVANLVEYLQCPANISQTLQEEATQLARSAIQAYDICGLLAVEMFLTQSGELLINEVAPRPHNSGHHTIDNAFTSQFEQLLRAILNLPPGDTSNKIPAIMVNLLGAEGHTGPAIYDGIEKCLELPQVKFHIYGKETTKPFRKMGHVTILGEDLEAAKEKADFIKANLKIITK